MVSSHLNSDDLLGLRLRHTGLSPSPFTSAAEAVSRLGAVQAQDFAAAKWALGLRVRDSTDADIEKAYNDGAVLRVHVLRPTWHLIPPEDIRWLLALTAPRFRASLASSDRDLGWDRTLLARSNAAMTRALEGGAHLTRKDIKSILLAKGIETNVRRLAHIVVHAELDGLICSGPRRGKQFTYALIEERAPKVKELGRVAGTWNKAIRKDAVEISLSPFRTLKPDERAALEGQAERFGKYLGIDTVELRE